MTCTYTKPGKKLTLSWRATLSTATAACRAALLSHGDSHRAPLAQTPASNTVKGGLVKFSSTGEAQWVKATHAASLYNMGVSGDGTLLAIPGSPADRGLAPFVSRIDLSAGNEGNVLWTNAGGGGAHGGIGGCEVFLALAHVRTNRH